MKENYNEKLLASIVETMTHFIKNITYLYEDVKQLKQQVGSLILDNEMIQKNIDYHQSETDRLLKLISRE